METFPYEKANFISKTCYWWVSKVLNACRGGSLTLDTLYACPSWLSTSRNGQVFLKYWKRKEARRKRGRKAFGWLWLVIGFGGGTLLISGLLTFGADLLAQQSTWLMRSISMSLKTPNNRNIVPVLKLLGVQIGRKVILNRGLEQISTIAYMLRAGIMTMVYERILLIPASDSAVGAGLNRLAVDSNRISTVVLFGHMLWSCPLRVLLSFRTVNNLIGLPAFTGISFILLTLSSLFLLARLMRSIRVRLAQISDERLQLTSEVLSHLAQIKTLPKSQRLINEIHLLRGKELKGIGRINTLFAIAASLNFWAPVMATTLSIVTAVLMGRYLEPSQLFAVARAFQMLMVPLWMMPTLVNRMVAASVSTKRIDSSLRSSPASSDSDIDQLYSISTEGTLSTDDKQCKLIMNNFSFKTGNLNFIGLNLQLEGHCLVGVISDNGEAKSALFDVLSGQIYGATGIINCPLNVAHCSSNVWLHSGTVKDNIVFGRNRPCVEFNEEEWLNVIMKACQLDNELTADREVGEGGSLLSGGQRCRISFARALYGRPKLLLVDNIFASLDEHVGDCLWRDALLNKSVMGNDLICLVGVNKTEHVRFCDRVIHLKAAYSEGSEKCWTLVDSGPCEVNTELNSPLSSSSSEMLIMRDECTEPKSSISGSNKWNLLRVVAQLMGGYLPTFILFVTIVGTDLSRLGRDSFLKKHTNEYISNDQRAFLLQFTTLGTLQGLFTACANLLAVRLCLRVSEQVHRITLERIIGASLYNVDIYSSGQLLNRLGRDLEILDYSFPEKVVSVMGSLSSLICTFFAIGFIVPKFLLTLIFPALLIGFYQRRFAFAWRILLRITSEAMGPVSATLSESIVGLSTIRLYKQGGTFLSRLNSQIDKYTVCTYLSVCARRWVSLRSEVVASCYVAALGIYCVYSSVDPASAGMLLLYALSSSESIDWFIKHLAEIDHSLNSVDRLVIFANSLGQESDHIVEDAIPKNVEIIYRNVGIRNNTIRNVNLVIGPGERVVMMGRTGVGKSSLVNALLRLCPHTGNITVGGVDLAKIANYRNQLIFSCQQNVGGELLFRNNGDFQDYCPKVVDKVFKVLFMDDMTTTGSQLINVAVMLCASRALEEDTNAIIILDESTSSLSEQEEVSLHGRLLEGLAKTVTLITITHRPTVARLYPRTLTINDQTCS